MAQSITGESANVVRMVEGRYDLTVKSTGDVFGFEAFSLLVHADGSRTLESRIVNNDVRLFRSVIYRIDSRFHPLDCRLVLHKDGTQLGSASFGHQLTGCSSQLLERAPFGAIARSWCGLSAGRLRYNAGTDFAPRLMRT